MKTQVALVTLLFASPLLAQAPAPAARSLENLNAVAWMQTSPEYQALVRQTYRAAETALLQALREPSWTAALEQTGAYVSLPPAVILDLDETVLDNSAYSARRVVLGAAFSDDGWNEWVKEAKAGLVPGAASFLAFAHARGVALFYVTNRQCDPERPDDPTVAVLRRHLLPLQPGRLLCRTGSSDKSPRRAQVAVKHRVLLLIGDDFNDFMTATPDARAAAFTGYERYWGERWFVLPNPTYGSWERSTGYGAQEKLDKLRR